MKCEKRHVCCKLCYAAGEKEEDCVKGLQSFKKHLKKKHGAECNDKKKRNHYYWETRTSNKDNKIICMIPCFDRARRKIQKTSQENQDQINY